MKSLDFHCLERHDGRREERCVRSRKTDLGEGSVSAVDTVGLDALGAEDAVGDARGVTVVAECEDALAAEDGHESLGAGVSVAVDVLDVEEALEFAPHGFQHGAVVDGAGEGAAGRSAVLENIEGDVDGVGEVEGVKVGRAAEIEDLGVGLGLEDLVDAAGAVCDDGLSALLRWNLLDLVEGVDGLHGLQLPGVVISVQIDIAETL